MGLIRSGVIVTLSTLLFLSLFFLNIFLMFNWSLEHENVVAHSALSNSLSTQNLTIDDIYYQNYNCSLFECIKNDSSPLALISKTSKDYFHQKLIFMILISAGLTLLMILFLEKKYSVFTISGILMILAALPFKKLDWAIKLLPDGKLAELFSIFFTKSINVFTTMLILGALLFVLGIAFEFLGFGLRLNKFLNKFRKKENTESEKDSLSPEDIQRIVKEEIKKEQTENEIKKIVKKRNKGK